MRVKVSMVLHEGNVYGYICTCMVYMVIVYVYGVYDYILYVYGVYGVYNGSNLSLPFLLVTFKITKLNLMRILTLSSQNAITSNECHRGIYYTESK